nr:MAG TPA: hypothetical protein [Bacteriophage sp.]
MLGLRISGALFRASNVPIFPFKFQAVRKLNSSR